MVAEVRLRELKRDYEGDLRFEWRSFLLRPEKASPPRTLEQFKGYTRSWARPASEEPRALFREWSSDEGPPSHSVPPHLVAKAAAGVSETAFERMHSLLFEAYFERNRDITDLEVLEELWGEAELPADRFSEWRDPVYAERVAAEYQEALEQGASGVPAVRWQGGFGVLMGAQSESVYRRWVEKLAEKQADPG